MVAWWRQFEVGVCRVLCTCVIAVCVSTCLCVCVRVCPGSVCACLHQEGAVCVLGGGGAGGLGVGSGGIKECGNEQMYEWTTVLING